ncbi:hypothetical protein [Pontibacter actiniarum]|uniref:Uncharacterized protein n=1 Tax=Pontibacter actiniarum TaxID=323450 RepID=A0A1X9YS19_9BACT|nr:hypothetical protein [Pontibacter actiniarum]ARS35690.1 hypothetical protein CA264_09690 [Pontibacter actiniarum]
MTDISENEMANTLRKNLLDVLDLWISKEEQLAYQENVPIAQVSSELFNQWEDFYYPESDSFKLAFDERERKILSDFDKILNHINDKTLNNLPYITDFIKTNDWQVVNKAAIDTKKRLKNTAANNI